MTIMHICAVRDAALNGYANPFVVPSPGIALRSFQQQVNEDPKNTELARTPEDYELYIMGTFDNETGVITQPTNGPERIARAKDLKQRKED